MKKNVLMLILVIIVFATGCANKIVKSPRVDEYIEYTEIEHDEIYEYILSVKEQSDSIRISLEQDTLTQVDMNMKSQELYKLWDDALNYLWGELKSSLPEEEFVKLQTEQRIWIEEKEKTIEEAGKEFQGGSIYSLLVNIEAAKLTEERVFDLYTFYIEFVR